MDFALIIGRINLTICKESYTLVINPTIVKSSKLRVFLNYVYISIFFHVSHVKKHVTILLTEKQWIQYQSLFLFLYSMSYPIRPRGPIFAADKYLLMPIMCVTPLLGNTLFTLRYNQKQPASLLQRKKCFLCGFCLTIPNLIFH